MKKAIFVRHAKSSWKDLSLDDHDRTLNARGQRDAPIMAAALAEHYPEIDLVLCSTARRTRQTWSLFREHMVAKDQKFVPQLYHASAIEILDQVHTVSEDVNSILVFGHNPGMTSLYNRLSINRLDNLPTCGMFEVYFDGLWTTAGQSSATDGFLLYPKML